MEEVDAKTLKDIESVSEARRPLLAYGAIVLEEIIRLGQPKEIAISAFGVREGVLYRKLDAATQRRDPLISATEDLNLLRSRSPRHGEELWIWTDQLHRFASACRRPNPRRRLRHAACLLADIGWRAHPDYRGEQSLNLIAYGAFAGLDHPGRAYLALAIFFRHEGLSPDKVGSRIKSLAGHAPDGAGPPARGAHARRLSGLGRHGGRPAAHAAAPARSRRSVALAEIHGRSRQRAT